MKTCSKCGYEFTGDYCPNCELDKLAGKDKNITAKTEDASEKPKNTVSKVCKVIAGIYIAVMVLGSMIWGAQTADAMYNSAIGWGIFFGGSLVGLSTGMILFGIGEIIRLLDKK